MIRAPSIISLSAMILVAAGAVSGAVLALWSINAGGAARIGSLTLMQHYAGYDKAAARLFSNLPVTPEGRREIERLSRASLAQMPYNIPTTMRLAATETAPNGRLTSAGLETLKHSYDLVAVTRDGGNLRAWIALDNWSALSPTLRQQAIAEFKALGKIKKERARLSTMTATVSDPRGKATGLMLLALIDIEVKQRHLSAQ